jgi:hypothetical protein
MVEVKKVKTHNVVLTATQSQRDKRVAYGFKQHSMKILCMCVCVCVFVCVCVKEKERERELTCHQSDSCQSISTHTV